MIIFDNDAARLFSQTDGNCNLELTKNQLKILSTLALILLGNSNVTLSHF